MQIFTNSFWSNQTFGPLFDERFENIDLISISIFFLASISQPGIRTHIHFLDHKATNVDFPLQFSRMEYCGCLLFNVGGTTRFEVFFFYREFSSSVKRSWTRLTINIEFLSPFEHNILRVISQEAEHGSMALWRSLCKSDDFYMQHLIFLIFPVKNLIKIGDFLELRLPTSFFFVSFWTNRTFQFHGGTLLNLLCDIELLKSDIHCTKNLELYEILKLIFDLDLICNVK